MKSVIKTTKALSLAILPALLFGGMAVTANAAQDVNRCGAPELKMDKGSFEVNRAGAVISYDYCEYSFYAKKGQKVSAKLVGSDDLYPILYSTTSPDISENPVTLTKTGTQTIRVLQPRAQARQSNTPKPYYLTVTIK
ncbi:hypothetical protein [Psychrobacter ciconiae]|uniref:hypothetical protein n=1 Tax=Psychrobacter ciconiae TaxID=1553449 RepID=UPI00191A1AFA|nr:hypothetical protein [Psychrobacter ciconiae]